MKRLLTLAVVLVLTASVFSTLAQRPARGREGALTEMRNFKHKVLTTELALSSEQEEPFFTAYDAMDAELFQLREDLAKMQQDVTANEQATDVEIEAAARALYEQSTREGEIQMRYYDTFRGILTPRQLLNLRAAERKCTQQMVRQHGRLRNNK